MNERVAIVGAGVSGLTCAVVIAERGYPTAIFADETGQRTTSAAAAAIWYPYDVEPADKVITWALETYRVLVDLSAERRAGVSMMELRQFSRAGEVQIPHWAHSLGASVISTATSVMSSEVETSLAVRQSELLRKFKSGFALTVPLMDTTIYLDYLMARFLNAGGEINANVQLNKLEEVGSKFDLMINCAGIGARSLVDDPDLEPHRGQVVIVPKIDLGCAIVCDDPPLMYAVPRANDCVFGGTNELSDDRDIDPAVTSRIVAECSRVLNIGNPPVLAARVGLRPFRKSGVRLERDHLRDGRTVIHNYGHGGSGFTLSWGCAENVLRLIGPSE
jgi:D-amino-acid oxidase